MSGFTVYDDGHRFYARHTGTGFTSVQLDFVADFNYDPQAIPPDALIRIDAVKISMTTSVGIGTRRADIELWGGSGFMLLKHQDSIGLAASQANKNFYFAPTLTDLNTSGATWRVSLPPELHMADGWYMVLGIANSKVGDTLDEVIVSGAYV